MAENQKKTQAILRYVLLSVHMQTYAGWYLYQHTHGHKEEKAKIRRTSLLYSNPYAPLPGGEGGRVPLHYLLPVGAAV